MESSAHTHYVPPEVSKYPRPCYDRVLVRQRAAETKKGDLIIPEVAQERPLEGTILAVGQGPMLNPDVGKPPFEVGDRVLFGKYGGTNIVVGDEELKLLQFTEVLAVLPEGAP